MQYQCKNLQNHSCVSTLKCLINVHGLITVQGGKTIEIDSSLEQNKQ